MGAVRQDVRLIVLHYMVAIQVPNYSPFIMDDGFPPILVLNLQTVCCVRLSLLFLASTPCVRVED